MRFMLEDTLSRGEIDEKIYQFFKEKLQKILFENFSQKILPHTSGVLYPRDFKTEEYLNEQKIFDSKVLEFREYIGIVPEAQDDLEAPSLVTALTPAKYEQPWHDHDNNWEITFYTGRSNGKYELDGERYILEADFGDFIIFPPKTYHTIENPTDKPVKNMSVKLPWALLDRGKEYQRGGAGRIEKMKETAPGVREARFEAEGVPYFSKMYSFDENIKNHTICPENKSLLYVLDGGFSVSWLPQNPDDTEIAQDNFAILLDKWTQIDISSLKKSGHIYMIELLDNWKDFTCADKKSDYFQK